MSKYALEVANIKKSFRLPVEQSNGIKQTFVNWTRGVKGYRKQEVLKGISFRVEKGEFFGIVGRNGSGKSTLLKIISQIYEPDAGNVAVHGKLVPFIELGVGFNPELTGRENIYLNGALLGFSHEEVAGMYDEIVDFAELHDFMDQKLKNYSSGMQVRLAFSIAIKAQGDILVLDEVLAVGDEAFQRKCNDFFVNIKKDKSKTVILVTHDMASVKKYCSRAILIKDGKVIVDGDKEDVANSYIEENLRVKHEEVPDANKRGLGLSEVVPHFAITPVSRQVLKHDDNCVFRISYTYTGEAEPHLAFTIHDNSRGGPMYDSGPLPVQRGSHSVEYSFPVAPFNNTDFKVVASLRSGVSDNEPGVIEGFTSDAHSCLFSVRDAVNSDYALLKSDFIDIKEVQ